MEAWWQQHVEKETGGRQRSEVRVREKKIKKEKPPPQKTAVAPEKKLSFTEDDLPPGGAALAL